MSSVSSFVHCCLTHVDFFETFPKTRKRCRKQDEEEAQMWGGEGQTHQKADGNMDGDDYQAESAAPETSALRPAGRSGAPGRRSEEELKIQDTFAAFRVS